MLQSYSFQRICSWIFRKITRITWSWFKNPLIMLFAKFYKINWDESKYQHARNFKHFNAFFTRELKEGARIIDDAMLIAPADGRIAAYGQLSNIDFIEAKGHQFDLASLLANPHLATEFNNGQFATIYLSPRDYHRIHMPINGRLLQTTHIPGRLYSVSIATTKKVPTLFAENERLVCLFETQIGKVIVILVGAINVSSMETVWAGEITPPYGKVISYKDYHNAEIFLKKGEELGRFNMGSTVIVITEKQLENQPLSFAQSIGYLNPIKLGNALLEKTDTKLMGDAE